MTANEVAPPKPKFKRASGPKVRTGSRHLKCDQDKPFCRRCRDDKLKCAGYAMIKPPKQRKRRQPNVPAVQPVAQPVTISSALNEVPLLTDLENLYFQHFLQWTTKQLSVPPASKNFWLRYALPIAYNSEPIRYSMIAVGASHRLFMARSVGFSHPWELKRLAIHQCSKAIASILPSMSAKSTSNMHCILVCCLLFISFEALSGRYAELFRRFRAGNQLFHTPQPISTPEEGAVAEKLVEMFCRLGVESSNFMDEHGLPGELRQLDLRQADKPWDSCREIESGDQSDEEGRTPSLTPEDSFRQWSSRLEATARVKEASLSTEAESHLRNLRLPVAAPFIAMNQTAFSLDGDLIPGLSFVASIAQHDGIKSQALDFLRNLNRREGIWDSHDVVEMRQLIMSVDGSHVESGECVPWCKTGVPAGIPGLIEELRRRPRKSTKAV
ncbi:hypothetical protein B0T10DRAFT_527390 [Thelonectria olida]|uniref:Zn(2)-C6 fungal-type domain-containing protein n=1 Tax=Thelonectria olida TaxID=1576542 RepID=A0A9P8WEI5_9HYPO|nr:hypothetical protein B0T10DRAFT_527390 [Thelonectria olida]